MTGSLCNTGISIIIFGSSGLMMIMFRRAIPAARNECNGCRALLCSGLGFTRRFAYCADEPKPDPCYIGLERDGVILHISSFLGEVYRAHRTFVVDDVDALHASTQLGAKHVARRIRATHSQVRPVVTKEQHSIPLSAGACSSAERAAEPRVLHKNAGVSLKLAGFAVRGSELVLYIAAGFEGRDVLLAKLGKHKTGKVCVYIRRLANVDLKVLETLVARSVADTKRRYPQANEADA